MSLGRFGRRIRRGVFKREEGGGEKRKWEIKRKWGRCEGEKRGGK